MKPNPCVRFFWAGLMRAEKNAWEIVTELSIVERKRLDPWPDGRPKTSLEKLKFSNDDLQVYYGSARQQFEDWKKEKS